MLTWVISFDSSLDLSFSLMAWIYACTSPISRSSFSYKSAFSRSFSFAKFRALFKDSNSSASSLLMSFSSLPPLSCYIFSRSEAALASACSLTSFSYHKFSTISSISCSSSCLVLCSEEKRLAWTGSMWSWLGVVWAPNGQRVVGFLG